VRLIALILLVLVVLAGTIAFMVWRADTAPVTATPSAVDVGREKLHEQFEETKQHESEIEKRVWNSTDPLVKLIQWHKQRMAKLASNPQAVEIVAYDADSVTRIQNRINKLAELEDAREEAEAEKEKEDAAAAKAAAAAQKLQQ
jgi:hypothetical protein